MDTNPNKHKKKNRRILDDDQIRSKHNKIRLKQEKLRLYEEELEEEIEYNYEDISKRNKRF